SFAVALMLGAVGDLHGLSASLAWDSTVVEPLGFESGELLDAQEIPIALLSPRPGAVDLALLDPARGLSGSGAIARIRFRVRAEGAPAIVLNRKLARDASNRPIVLGAPPVTVAAPAPRRTMLEGVHPNPFARSVSIDLALHAPGPVRLAIFDLTGRRVKDL